MISRRDALKIAAAAAAPAASGLTRAEAARLLDKPTSPDLRVPDDWRERTRDAVATDPANFAEELMRWGWTDDVANDAPAEYAEYKKARAAFLALYPDLETVGAHHPFELMEEAMYALWSTSHLQGVRAGAAAEHFRQIVVGPVKTCWPCHGVGVVKNAACRSCNGHGTVPVGVIQERGR